MALFQRRGQTYTMWGYGFLKMNFFFSNIFQQLALLYNDLEGSVEPLLGLTQIQIIGLGYNKYLLFPLSFLKVVLTWLSFQGAILGAICNFENLTVLNTIGNQFTG